MPLLIVLGCLIGLLIIVGAGYGARVRSEIRRLSPVPTGLVVDGIYAIRDGHVNMYLIHRNGTYVAMDAGRTVEGVAKGLKELNIDRGAVVAGTLGYSVPPKRGAIGVVLDQETVDATVEQCG